jgi:hypothetical protein
MPRPGNRASDTARNEFIVQPNGVIPDKTDNDRANAASQSLVRTVPGTHARHLAKLGRIDARSGYGDQVPQSWTTFPSAEPQLLGAHRDADTKDDLSATNDAPLSLKRNHHRLSPPIDCRRV